MTTNHPNPARLHALRACLAVAQDDSPQLVATLRDAAAEPGGVLGLVVALCRMVNANAEALAPDWLDQLRLVALAEAEGLS